MANIIKYTGNVDRFMGQRKGTLLDAKLQIVKEISTDLRKNIGEDAIPRGSAILCVYIGENGIPFVELRGYGSASLRRLKNSIGQEFAIDYPATESKPVQIDFSGEENKCGDAAALKEKICG